MKFRSWNKNVRDSLHCFIVEPKRRESERLLLLRATTGSEAFAAAKHDSGGADVWPVGKLGIEDVVKLIAPDSTENPIQLWSALRYIESVYTLTPVQRKAFAGVRATIISELGMEPVLEKYK